MEAVPHLNVVPCGQTCAAEAEVDDLTSVNHAVVSEVASVGVGSFPIVLATVENLIFGLWRDNNV